MIGLVWNRVKAGELVLEPDDHRNLAAESLKTEFRHHQLSAALSHASERLLENGIEVATFKGVAAEQRWYDQVGDRPCWDVDLLLAPHNLDRAGELIEILQPKMRNDGRLQRLVDSGALQTIDIEFDGVVLDLHFDLFKLGFRSRQQKLLWERSLMVSLPGGESVRALDGEISLIFSLLHLNRDRFAKLLGFAEVVRIVERQEIDWDFVEAFVEVEGLETSHRLALGVVCETLGIEPPVPVATAGWRSKAWSALWPPEQRLLGEEGRLSFGRRSVLAFSFLVRGRKGDAARYVLRRMLPNRDMVDVVHPGTQGPYLWRLVNARVGQRMKRRRERRALEQARGS
jgi:hypothetical protein